MGLRLEKIGKAINWVPSVVKRHPLVSYFVIFVVYLLISKFCFEENPMWYNILFFVISGWTYTVIDNQLPSRKNKNMFLMFAFMAFGLVCIGVGGVVSGQMAFESGMWILVGMMLICLGYGLYCFYCWRRRVLWYKEIALQRELRAKRKKKLEY